MDRRDFLRAGLAGGAAVLAPRLDAQTPAPPRRVALVLDPTDPIAEAPPVQLAAAALREALTAAGFAVRQLDRLERADADELCVWCAGGTTPAATAALTRARRPLGSGPERLALLTTRVLDRTVLLAIGSDPVGAMYALRELADRVRPGGSAAALLTPAPIVQAPANPVRSVMRQFTSDTLDSPWLFDREMWPRYLAMLAGCRFNRLHLAFGLGYDSLQRVVDSYLLFLYPFLVAPPGYDVRVTNVTAADRDRHLEALRFISEQTVAHGLRFQLGIWTHGYALTNSPDARYVVEGLTPETHAAYCRDALTAVLRACPAISAVALRIHGESGVAEGSYGFWGTVFDGVPRAGRAIEIDLHAKGLDHRMIDRALATGMPVNVSPKYWAEHLGMPYHQTAIRELEMPVAGQTGRGLMTLSEGALSFTRYGYADFLRDGRRYTVRHRVFAGTQRLLLAGDPAAAAAYGRAYQFCGSTGMDLMEPLTCRGRRGTGLAGARRSGYVDAALEPRWDWEKYEYWYRVSGRRAFDPEADASAWRRGAFDGAGSEALAGALASASRILPIVTTAHLPSAACDAYWPEVYWNQPIVEEPRPNPYGDSPAPKTFAYASPLDPQLFTSVAEHAAEAANDAASGKYSPIDVAQWLEDLAADVERQLAALGPARTADVRRVVIDVRMQAALGRFFAARLRSGVLYALSERVGDRRLVDAAVERYRAARAAWTEVVAAAQGVYASDLSASDKISNRGCWADRLPAIDEDIARMAARSSAHAASSVPSQRADPALVRRLIAAALGRPSRPAAPCTHTPPARFRPGAPLRLEVMVAAGAGVTVRCWYRHVNQAERFEHVELRAEGGRHVATVPAAYTDSPYPLQYYFVVNHGRPDATLVPGLGHALMDQPYFVIHRA